MPQPPASSAHEPALLTYLEALPAQRRADEMALLIGLLAGECAVLAGRRETAGLLYALADHVVAGSAHG